MRRPFEDDGDLCDPSPKPFAGPQVEGHPGPATIIDGQPNGSERLRRTGGGDPLLFKESHNRHPALPARLVLPSGRMEIDVRGNGDRAQDLFLLLSDFSGTEGEGLLHGGECKQLQKVVLDDIACSPDAVVVASPATDPDVFSLCDLHIVHVVGVPDRFKHGVGETNGQDVLNCLLAQVVVDAEDLIRSEG